MRVSLGEWPELVLLIASLCAAYNQLGTQTAIFITGCFVITAVRLCAAEIIKEIRRG